MVSLEKTFGVNNIVKRIRGVKSTKYGHGSFILFSSLKPF